MKHQKDQDGWYTTRAETASGTMRTRLCPVDITTTESWAKSLIQKAADATEHGFGLCHDDSAYDLDNFLADTLVGDVPWDNEKLKAVHMAMQAEPNFVQVMTAFKAKYGRTLFHLTWAEELKYMGEPEDE